MEVAVEAQVFLVNVYLHLWYTLGILAQNVYGVVSRPIVLHNDLGYGVGLCQDAVHLLAQEALAIVGTHHNGYGWCFFHIFYYFVLMGYRPF